jgi:sigma-B regulation protein RsbU (phosphoserine phosphatase)
MRDPAALDWRRAPSGLFRADAGGEVLEANDRFAELLGRPAGQLRGLRLDDLLAPPSRVVLEVSVRPKLRPHAPMDEIRLTFVSKSGQQVPMLLSIRVDANGTLEAACLPVPSLDAFHADIMRAKESAEAALKGDAAVRSLQEDFERQSVELDRKVRALEAAGQDLEQLGGALYHSLREPVRKISLLTDLLANGPGAEAETTRHMAVGIKGSVKNLASLLGLLQGYLSLIAPAERALEVDLRACASAAAERARGEHPDAGLVFRCGPLPAVEGARAQLEMLFFDLIDNAVRYRREGGAAPEVSLTGEVVQHNAFRPESGRYRYADFARLVFQDNSRGLKPTPSLFHIFSRPEPGHAGLGAGLARCRRIVDNHFGYIRLDDSDDAGARFVILLPLRQ